MKPIVFGVLLGIAGPAAMQLAAADAWEAKPFTEWTKEDAQKVLSNSPWTRQVVNYKNVAEDSSTFSGGGKRGIRGGTGTTLAKSMTTVIWESARPVRQAFAVLKFGAEASTSSQVKDLLAQEPTEYAILVTGFPASVVEGDADKFKQGILKKTSLGGTNGKGGLAPKDIQILPDNKAVALFITFAKDKPLTEADQDVEFDSKIGESTVKCKFHLPDMLYNGKLEL